MKHLDKQTIRPCCSCSVSAVNGQDPLLDSIFVFFMNLKNMILLFRPCCLLL